MRFTLRLVMARLLLCPFFVAGLRQLTVSSLPFDPLVSGARCGAAPVQEVTSLAALPSYAKGSNFVDTASHGTASAGVRRCSPKLQWIIELSERRALSGRLDVGGGGVPEGWVLRFDFGAGGAMRLSGLVGGHLLTHKAGVLIVMPRLASGLGTMMISVERDPQRDQEMGDRPTIECVAEPSRTIGEVDGGWRTSEHENYLWMAREFNRQYINSHGKEHHEYQPNSADEPKQLHYLNGRS